MQLKCEQCGAPFQIDDLNLDHGLATCSACGGVQRLHIGVAASQAHSADNTKPTAEVPKPPGFSVEDNGAELVITQRWFQWAFFFLLFFAIAWDSFLIGWYWMLTSGPFGGPNGMPGPMRVIFFVFPICHVAVGVGLTYFVLVGFLNSTIIRVADGTLSVRHGPLPWLGNMTMSVDDIEQVFCQKKVSTSRDDDGSVSTNRRYEVHAVVAGHKRKLLGGLHEPDHALFVEQRLEKFLNIVDRVVPGEMSIG